MATFGDFDLTGYIPVTCRSIDAASPASPAKEAEAKRGLKSERSLQL